MERRTARRAIALTMAGVTLLAACGSDAKKASPTTAATASSAASTTAAPSGDKATLRLGYFPNVTHSPALVGIHDGIFAKDLGANVKLETTSFNAGPAAVEALFGGAIDASFVGPNPAINAYAKSKGAAIRIISGSTAGGALFIVAPSIKTATDLKGKSVASPQLGGTQDVALRSWLKGQGLSTDTSGGGDVTILPQANADTLTAFKSGSIVGAWVPEPWATRLIQEGDGHVLVDEKTLWPAGQFVTTLLIVSTDYLNKHPDVIQGLLTGVVDSVAAIAKDPTAAQASVNAEIAAVTGKPLSDAVMTAAWKNLSFTVDPIASSLSKSAKDAEGLGLLDAVDLSGIFDLDPLNKILTGLGQPEVKGL